MITRAFTIYQLANILVNELPKVIQQYEAKMIVISDLLDMFVHDPQIEVNEAKYLINEIVNSITKSRVLEDIIVIVSLLSGDNASHHDKSTLSLNKTILTRFDKCIEIMNNENENKMIDIRIRDNNKNNIRRNKNSANDFHDGKLLSINNRELLTVSAPK